MPSSLQPISLPYLALSFIPVFVVIGIIWRWKIGTGRSLHALARMLIQLLLIGYFLNYIIKTENSLIVLAVLSMMLIISSWIALGTIKIPRRVLFFKSFGAISLSGVFVLILVTQGVLRLDPWYSPREMITLAGMIFANSMTSISLAGERLLAEMERDVSYKEARTIAFQASLIPIINSLFAVGLVSLPGMMTGQILSGVSPLIAARYQIMVMCMIFGSTGLASAFFLYWIKVHLGEITRKVQ